MRRLYILAFMPLSVASSSAYAATVCNSISNTSKEDFTIKGTVVKQTGGKPYKIVRTDSDNLIPTECSRSWEAPINDWHYGSQFFLYKEDKSNKDDTVKAAKTEYQTDIHRFECIDSTIRTKNNVVGWYSYSSSGNIAKLEFLCTVKDHEGKGIGLEMINNSVEDLYKKLTKGTDWTLKILSHKNPNTIKFYNGLEMDCDKDKATNGEDAFRYSRRFETDKQNTRIDRKARCYDSTQFGGEKYRIEYSEACMSLKKYRRFTDLNTNVRNAGHNNDVIVAQCNGATKTMSMEEVTSDIKNNIGMH